MDRKIVSPDGLFVSIMGDKAKTGEYQYEVWGDDMIMTISSTYYKDSVWTNRQYINSLMMDEGLDPADWDWAPAS